MSANDRSPTTSHAASTEVAASTVKSGPKISSRRRGEEGSRAVARAGAANQPGPAGTVARPSTRPSASANFAGAGKPRLGFLLDQRWDLRVEIFRLADAEQFDCTGEALGEGLRNCLMGQHPRDRRALLARIPEGRADDRGNCVVEVRVGVHDRAVLPPHFGDDSFHVTLVLGGLGRAADHLQADRARTRERDRVDPGVTDEPRAGFAMAGQERECAGGNACLAERLDQAERAAGGLLGGL